MLEVILIFLNFKKGNKKIIGQAPTLATGNYRVRVKTQVTENSKHFLKDIMVGDSTFSLAVA
ncbi:hypothetical protein MHM83_09295 [Tenacibaculum sp. Mcav3-52]|uniref:hypothetical protein n=1 Tax=unclassified Tenacibaculum TaxID=2635139 RepID=UPI001EF2205C|nr:hypothetical protein [Tenacibaculum sp. Mcav3-52]MCG7502064.1 hypothetical protein [Tenacibaculum sp. Mcav3-52]